MSPCDDLNGWVLTKYCVPIGQNVWSTFEVCYSYSTVPGICGSKQTKSRGVVQGQGLFTTARNLWPPVAVL